MASRSTSILTIAGLTVVGGAIAYAVYFDHKRRNDVDFRKKLRKEKKRVDKSVAQSKESLPTSASPDVSPAALREALEQVKSEEAPQTPEQKEAYFMAHVSTGEQLSLQGPEFHLAAALSFYRALRVYPSPVELIVIYQKTVPEPIFKLVMDMTNLDVKSRVEGYFDSFPPKGTNVKVETRKGRKVLVAAKDFAAGETIYQEHPIVAVLDADVQAAGTHCSHCFRVIQLPMSIPPEDPNLLSSTFCSKACLVSNKAQSHSLLFTTESPLPAEMGSTPVSSEAIEARRSAQTDFVAHLQAEERAGPLLVARFIARQVAMETLKMVQGKKSTENDFTDAESGDYLLADHMERLRFIDVVPPAGALGMLVKVLQTALPGLEQFVTEERYTILLGKMAYNAFGVCFGGGRDDKPALTARPEDVEKSRTPYGTARQIGSAVYTVSSYITHSCSPAARPSFASGTTELHLIANHDIKKDDTLTIAYVDVTQRPDESVIECRRRRRIEIVRGWRFACDCERCAQEGKVMSTEEKDADPDVKDESKMEESLTRYEDGERNNAVE